MLKEDITKINYELFKAVINKKIEMYNYFVDCTLFLFIGLAFIFNSFSQL